MVKKTTEIRPRSGSENKGVEKSDATGSSTMVLLLLLSILFASGNTILYKATLNSFSSPTTNYGFFVSQFSTLCYVIQALVCSIAIVIRNYDSLKELLRIPQSIYLYMGLLDAASATMGAIAG
jgi:hypothetical protein